MIVDAHQHFWDPARDDYGWLNPGLRALWRPFMPKHLCGDLAQLGIDGTILVQAAPTEAETDFLLQIANSTKWVLGVVGWVDLESARAGERLEHYSRQKFFRGVRPMLQDLPDPSWITNNLIAGALDAMASLGLTLDALIRPEHISHILQVSRQHPRLAIVVDHAAKPDIARSPTPEWQDGMRQLAQRPNVACKLSGLVSQAPALLAPSAYARHFDFLLDVFAPDRLLWGSDWPVLTERCSYVDWWDITGQLLHGIPARSRDAILGLTAQTIYRLERP